MKKTNFMNDGIEPSYIALLFTSLPTLTIISIFLMFNQKNVFFIFIPFGLLFLSVLFKPLEKCEFCGKLIEHKVEGLFDHHIQCDCVKNRWRPIWYLWCENLHNKIFKKSVSNF